ncbi:MAG: thiol reductant ABC exporter subunit CydC [Rhodococcus sp.]|uniref:thiol reductant ABC exporter subunit CydC n=1 Tax=Rhodococcus TaxID=1827 RepID=UPI0016A96F4A|nr:MULTISPECIES: thiol reductant ABC exporter subunit CydC [Rhodococcus]NLV79790.1 thiol reductant ABC exporter subunit CydC [Rhodococcus sp. (in: high G+C Gram-positive bacteria)]
MSDLRRAMALLELEPRRVLLAILAGVATLGSALTLAGLSAWLIIRAWEMPPVLDLTVAVVAVRALGISRGIFRYLERIATHDTALRGTTAARAGLYRRLAEGDPAAAAGLARGDLLARTGADVDALGDVVVRALVPIAVAAVLGVAAVVTVGVIAPAAGAILAGALLVAGVVAPRASARAAARADADGDAERTRFTETAVTVLDHAAELRVAGRLGTTTRRARTANIASVRATDRSAVPAAFADAAAPLALGAAVLGSLLVGIVAIGSGPDTIAVTTLGILVLLPLSAFEATEPLPGAAKTLSRARLAATRIVELLDRAERPVPHGTASADGPGGLRATGLRSAWPGGVVTEAVDVDVEPGARIAIVGASGSGKTTTLMTLAGLLPPAAGSVTLDGVDLADLDPAALRRRVGFFAEDAHVFDTSILENLRVARGDVAEAEAHAVLAAVGLGGWVASLPDGVHTSLQAGARAVSGGQRRRLLLARALLSPATVLLLDEPAEHLDATDAAHLQRQLLDRSSGLVDPGRAVVLVTHQLPDDTAADRVLHVRVGSEAGPGTEVG